VFRPEKIQRSWAGRGGQVRENPRGKTFAYPCKLAGAACEGRCGDGKYGSYRRASEALLASSKCFLGCAAAISPRSAPFSIRMPMQAGQIIPQAAELSMRSKPGPSTDFAVPYTLTSRPRSAGEQSCLDLVRCRW